MSTNTTKRLASVCHIGGFGSIIVSILVWSFFKGSDPAHGERFGIFIGLWAPTFFTLSDKYARDANRA